MSYYELFLCLFPRSRWWTWRPRTSLRLLWRTNGAGMWNLGSLLGDRVSVVGTSVSVSGGKVTSEMCSFKMHSATLTDLCHGEAMRHAGRNVRLLAGTLKMFASQWKKGRSSTMLCSISQIVNSKNLMPVDQASDRPADDSCSLRRLGYPKLPRESHVLWLRRRANKDPRVSLKFHQGRVTIDWLSIGAQCAMEAL